MYINRFCINDFFRTTCSWYIVLIGVFGNNAHHGIRTHTHSLNQSKQICLAPYVAGESVVLATTTNYDAGLCTNLARDSNECAASSLWVSYQAAINSAFHPFGIDKWVVSCNQTAAITTHSSGALWWTLRGEGRCDVFAGNTAWMWSTHERLRGELLTMRSYTNLRLALPYTLLTTRN